MAIAQQAVAGWTAGFESLETETTTPLTLELIGALPTDLSGTIYRIGPARFDVYGERYRHWFDGDGMVHALTLADGQATYRNRFVATAKKRAEDAARRRIYGEFGTPPAGGPLTRFQHRGAGNAANTNVVSHGGRLLALWEGGRPYRLDPLTLHTLGEDDLGGALGPHDAYSAHPKLHQHTGDLWNFGVQYGRTPQVALYRGRPDGSVERVATVPLPVPAMIHDFLITATRAVLVVPPIVLPGLPLALLLGQQSFADALRWRPELGTHVGLVDLATGDARWYRTEPFMLFHTINAWDDGADVVADVCAYPDATIMDFFYAIMRGRPGYAVLPWAERLRLRADGRVERRRVADVPFEFPRVAGHAPSGQHQRVYGVTWTEAADFLGAPVGIDLPTGQGTTARLGPGQYAGECVPVPKRGSADERDVWLLTLVLDAPARRSELWVLDGGDVAAPPVARVLLPHAVPFGFHGNWVPA